MRGYRNRFPVSIARRDLPIVAVRLAQLSKGAEDPGAYCNVAEFKYEWMEGNTRSEIEGSVLARVQRGPRLLVA